MRSGQAAYGGRCSVSASDFLCDYIGRGPLARQEPGDTTPRSLNRLMLGSESESPCRACSDARLPLLVWVRITSCCFAAKLRWVNGYNVGTSLTVTRRRFQSLFQSTAFAVACLQTDACCHDTVVATVKFGPFLLLPAHVTWRARRKTV